MFIDTLNTNKISYYKNATFKGRRLSRDKLYDKILGVYRYIKTEEVKKKSYEELAYAQLRLRLDEEEKWMTKEQRKIFRKKLEYVRIVKSIKERKRFFKAVGLLNKKMGESEEECPSQSGSCRLALYKNVSKQKIKAPPKRKATKNISKKSNKYPKYKDNIKYILKQNIHNINNLILIPGNTQKIIKKFNPPILMDEDRQNIVETVQPVKYNKVIVKILNKHL